MTNKTWIIFTHMSYIREWRIIYLFTVVVVVVVVVVVTFICHYSILFFHPQHLQNCIRGQGDCTVIEMIYVRSTKLVKLSIGIRMACGSQLSVHHNSKNAVITAISVRFLKVAN